MGNSSWAWLEENLDEAFADQSLLGTRHVPADNHTVFYLTPATTSLSGKNRRKAEALRGDAGEGKTSGDLIGLAQKRGYGVTALSRRDLETVLSDLKELVDFEEVYIVEQAGDSIPGPNSTVIDSLRVFLKKLGR